MRRYILRGIAVLALILTLSSCTGTQVQAWFQNVKGQEITWQQGHNIAVALNEWQHRQDELAALYRYLAAVSVPNGARWDRVAACESGGRWNLSTGNGYYGGLQFTLGTWRAYGGTGYPHQNSRATQIRVAERVRIARGGLGDWPVCGSRW